MKRHFTFIALLLCSSLAWATTYTTSANPTHWHTTTDWSPNGTPGAGDIVIITQPWICEVSTTCTFGTSPANQTTFDLYCSSTTGTATGDIYGTLQMQSNVETCNGNIVFHPGSSLMHDSSLAATPATTNYIWQVCMVAGSCANALIKATGTAFSGGNCATQPGAGVGSGGGNCVVFNSAVGSGVFGGFTQGGTAAVDTCASSASFSPSGQITGAGSSNLAYTWVSNFGVSGHPWITANLGLSASQLVLNHVVANSNDTSVMLTSSPVSGANISITNSNITTSGASGIALLIHESSNSATTGARLIQNSYIGGKFCLIYGNYTLSHSVFVNSTAGAAMDSGYTSTALLGTASNDLFINKANIFTTVSNSTYGTTSKLVMLNRSMSGDCVHWKGQGQVPVGTPGWTIDGMVIEGYGNGSTGSCDGSNGDGVSMAYGGASLASPIEIYVKNILFVPNAGSGTYQNSSKLAVVNSADSSGKLHFHVTHLTVPAGKSGIWDFEATTGYAGTLAELQGNIYWSNVASSAGVIVYQASTPVAGAITTAGVNNYWHTTNTGSALYQGLSTVYGNVAGTGDLNVNPNFVDPTRNMLTWANRVNGMASPTYDLVQNQWATYATPAWNSAWEWGDGTSNPNSYYNWVRAGFAPTNTALKGAAPDGGDIGAVPVVSLSNGGNALWFGQPF